MELTANTVRGLSPRQIRELVSAKYSEVALNPGSKYKFRVGKRYALDLGYPDEPMKNLPGELAETFTGVSSYLARCGEFLPGDVILELGAGGGLDAALLARKVGSSGKVIGLDLSQAMVRKAVAGFQQLGISPAHLCQGLAEEIPLRDQSVDWIVSNGIFNLSPEKARILKGIHRVLKPEGHVLCSEIVLKQEPSPEERYHQEDWFT
jgi:SAM-dependent methyltransferase